MYTIEIVIIHFPTLYRILNKYQSKQGNKSISIDFLFKCLDKYETEASILFENIDFSVNQTKYVNLLLTKYSKIFDFHFINWLLLKSVYDQQNEKILIEIESQSNLKKCQDEMNQSFSQKITELKKIEDDQNCRIENLENQMKIKDDEIQKLINENSKLTTRIQKRRNKFAKKRKRIV